jgi:glycerol-3-phosphate dehydrogenase subunit C
VSDQEIISYMPSDGISYDPSEALYWDESALGKEMTRAFEVCHGCRMCFKYCDSFPNLFKLLDESYDGDVRRLSPTDVEDVMNPCFQCKLCEVQCPYTPRKGHEFQLDFPKLVHRYEAIRQKKDGSSKRERFLADPDKGGRMARASLGLANVMNRFSLHRWFLEKVLGIHRKKLLPKFASKTFEKWAKKQELIRDPEGDKAPEAVLFQTCYVQNNEPGIGHDTVDVMGHNQVDMGCVEGLKCCGMPAWEHGNLDMVRTLAHENLNRLMPFVEQGAKVLVINPTCTMMLRQEWPELLIDEDRIRAKTLAEAVMSPSEYLWSIRKEERFNKDFKSRPGNEVGYHAPCHLRAQQKGFKGRDMLRQIPGVNPKMVMECCGHDGTYAMKVEGFEPSQRIGKKAFDGMIASDTKVWATDCPLAAIQFEQHAGVKPMHPMTVLARAYREDGFAEKIQSEGEDNGAS